MKLVDFFVAPAGISSAPLLLLLLLSCCVSVTAAVVDGTLQIDFGKQLTTEWNAVVVEDNNRRLQKSEDEFFVDNERGYLLIGEESITVGSYQEGWEYTVEGEIRTTDGGIERGAGTGAVFVENDAGEMIYVDGTTGTVTITDNKDGIIMMRPDGGYVAWSMTGGVVAGNDEGMIAMDGHVGSGSNIAIVSDEEFFASSPVGYIDIASDYIEFGSALGANKIEGNVEKTDGNVYVENGKGESIGIDGETGVVTIGSDAGSLIVTPKSVLDYSNYDVQFVPAGTEDGRCATVGEILCSLGKDFSYLCSLYEEYDGADKDASYTIFAPTDEAFQKVMGPLSTFSDEDKEKVFFFHFMDGAVMYDGLICKEKIEMIEGGLSRTACRTVKNGLGAKLKYKIQKGEANTRNDIEPIIIFPDIEACNDSVIHIVNEVMLPNFIDTIEASVSK